MKRFAFLFICFTSYTAFTQTKIGVQGGYNNAVFATGNQKLSGAQYSTKFTSINGFNAGITASFKLSKNLFFALRF